MIVLTIVLSMGTKRVEKYTLSYYGFVTCLS